MLWQMLSFFHLHRWVKREEHYPLLLWGLLRVYNFIDRKVFVSYHAYFKVEWKFPFEGLSKFWTFIKVFYFLGQSMNLLQNKNIHSTQPPLTN
jgi:hypothetical protein